MIQWRTIAGAPGKPVVVINRKGRVVVRTKKDYGILFDNCKYFKLTGSGDGSDSSGIEIAAAGNHGILITEFSSDADCGRKDLRYFIMRNLHFHHNLIHDTYAEGYYIGYPGIWQDLINAAMIRCYYTFMKYIISISMTTIDEEQEYHQGIGEKITARLYSETTSTFLISRILSLPLKSGALSRYFK